MDWKRHENNIYDKIIYWFEMIGKVLQDPAILPENVYNMDETGVMMCMLGSVKVIVGKDDPRDYRGAAVKRTMVAAIECISANGTVACKTGFTPTTGTKFYCAILIRGSLYVPNHIRSSAQCTSVA